MSDEKGYTTEYGFGQEAGPLEFSCERIQMSAAAGEAMEDAFVVRAGKPIKGYCLSTDHRMECLTERFSGKEVMIRYRFRGDYPVSEAKRQSCGMEESMPVYSDVTGFFQLITTAGEARLPFCVTLQHRPGGDRQHDSRLPASLTEFAGLAKKDWTAALKIFYREDFAGIFKGSDRRYLEWYRGFRAYPGNQQNLEAFLVACRLKEKVTLSVEEKELVCHNPPEAAQLAVNLYKETWGYTELTVSVEGDFLYLQKDIIYDDDFLGNRFRLPVYIDHAGLHLGKNTGCVRIEGPGILKTVAVQVQMGELCGSAQAHHLERERLLVELLTGYQNYRLKKIAGSLWLEQSNRLVERLVTLDDTDIVSRLFQAQLLIFQERQHEGSWVLTHALELMEKEEIADPGMRAYYLYLTTLVNRDREYVRSAAARVEDLYRRGRTDWRVAWFMLFLSPELYRNDASRWNFLEKQFQYGCNSPIWYMEAFLTLTANPALLRRLGTFEIQVLFYGARRKGLSEDLKSQLFYLAGRKREYSPILLKLLILLQEQQDDARALLEICSQLIKGENRTPRAHKWYALGVERELRITRLYECYMNSMDLSAEPEISRKALLYFSWQSNLDYEHTAYLYYYILKYKKDDTELYIQYRERMEHFVVDQLLKGRTGKYPAYLYQELLSPALFSGPVAAGLSEILFAVEVKVPDKNIVRLVVCRPDIRGEYSYPVTNGVGYPVLYGEKDVLLAEDREGNRCSADSISCTRQKLMNAEKWLELTASYLPCGNGAYVAFDKYLWDKNRKAAELDGAIAARGRGLLRSEVITDYVKGRIWMRLIYDARDRSDARALLLLLDEVPWEVLDASSRAVVIQCLIQMGRMGRAGEWLGLFGPQGVEAKAIFGYCDWQLRQNVQEELLTECAFYAYSHGEYSRELVEYLGRFYRGSLEELERLWRLAGELEADAYELSERILEQLLFTGASTGGRSEIFRYYVRRNGRSDLAAAYLKRCAYEYLALQRRQDDFIFREIGERHRNGGEIARIEKLSFVKYVTDNVKRSSQAERDVARSFAEDLLAEGICLNMFRKLPQCRELLAGFGELTIVEHIAPPDTRMTIHYTVKDRQTGEEFGGKEEMKPVEGGIFSKEFVLFFGEVLEYYLVLEQERQKEITQSFQVEAAGGISGSGYYRAVNELLESRAMEDYSRLDDAIEDLYHKEYLSSRLFTMR